MFRRNLPASTNQQAGMTLVELLITMTVTLVVAATFYTFFRTNFFSYLNLQKDASGFTGLASQSQRIGNVMRGLTDITAADDDEVTIYSYFFPTDTYVSLVHYYQNADGTILYADVTPMTSNPPIGTPINENKKTYTVINNLKLAPGVKLFEYLDSAGNTLPLPISDLHTIKGVRVNLAVSNEASPTNQVMTVQVSLRNRKTNL